MSEILLNSTSNRNTYETLKKEKTQTKKWMYKLANWPGARATAIFEFFLSTASKTRERVAAWLTSQLLKSGRHDGTPNRTGFHQFRRHMRPRRCLLLLDYGGWTVQPTAAWGPRGRGQWECGQRLVATNQSAERREGAGRAEERRGDNDEARRHIKV